MRRFCAIFFASALFVAQSAGAAPRVSVQVYQRHDPVHRDCEFEISNQGSEPIRWFTIGLDNGQEQFAALPTNWSLGAGGPVPSGPEHAPPGWAESIIWDKLHRRAALRWEGAGREIYPGQTLRGFLVTFPAAQVLSCSGVHWIVHSAATPPAPLPPHRKIIHRNYQ